MASTPVTPPYVPPVGSYAGQPFTGVVMAASVPMVGASVQVYAAGATGNGSAPTQLLANALTTDSTGAFSVTAAYTCPYNTSVLYLVAKGGKAGATGTANEGTVLMSSPGACDAITSGASFTLNELTTVASAYALGQFLAAGGQLGATATNTAGLTLAAGTLTNLVSLTKGTAPGPAFPATGTAPVALLDVLANALNACIVSSGAGSTACASLYSDSAKTGDALPANTLDAALAIARHPGDHPAAIYALGAGSSSYGSTAGTAPADLTLAATFTGGGMAKPTALALDSAGNVWVANFFNVASLFSNTGMPLFAAGVTGHSLHESYGAAVDTTDRLWVANQESAYAQNGGGGTVSVLDAANSTTSVYAAGGVYYPEAIAVDTSDVTWVVDYGSSSVTLLGSDGTPLSGASGYNGVESGQPTLVFPVAIGIDSKRNGWVADQGSNTVTRIAADGSSFTPFVVGGGPSGVAVDAADNVWAANYYGDTVGMVSAAGVVTSGAGFGSGSLQSPQGIAADGAGTIWVANYLGGTITELAGAGGSVAAGTVVSPAGGLGSGASLLQPYALAIDAAGNVWVSNAGNSTLTEFIGLAAPVKTPLLGAARVP